MNSDYLQQKLSAATGRIGSLFPLVPVDQIVSNLYFATLSRPPSGEELSQAVGIVDGRQTAETKKQALEDLLWVLLNSREFMFNH